MDGRPERKFFQLWNLFFCRLVESSKMNTIYIIQTHIAVQWQTKREEIRNQKLSINFICPNTLENTRCNQIRLVFFGVPRRQTQFNKAQQHDSWGQVVEAASQNSTEISLDVSLMTRWLPCLGGTGGLPIHGCTDSSQAGWVLVRFWDAKLGMAKWSKHLGGVTWQLKASVCSWRLLC